MEYRNSYISPLGRILLTADEIGLTGLAFEGQKNAVQGLTRESEEKETTLFSGVKKWLDIYFSGVDFKDVESGGWKCYRTQPCVGDRSVSQSDRSKRKSDRICRRN